MSEEPAEPRGHRGEALSLAVSASDIHLFEAGSGRRLKEQADKPRKETRPLSVVEG